MFILISFIVSIIIILISFILFYMLLDNDWTSDSVSISAVALSAVALLAVVFTFGYLMHLTGGILLTKNGQNSILQLKKQYSLSAVMNAYNAARQSKNRMKKSFKNTQVIP